MFNLFVRNGVKPKVGPFYRLINRLDYIWTTSPPEVQAGPLRMVQPREFGDDLRRCVAEATLGFAYDDPVGFIFCQKTAVCGHHDQRDRDQAPND